MPPVKEQTDDRLATEERQDQKTAEKKILEPGEEVRLKEGKERGGIGKKGRCPSQPLLKARERDKRSRNVSVEIRGRKRRSTIVT